jgi:CarboxypepD_reg-like domain
MTFRSHSPRVLAIALLAITIAIPSFAAGKRRAATPTAPPVAGKVTGTVVDAGNARPVVFATVSAGEIATSTDAQGKFELDVPGGTMLTFSRTGYQTVTRAVPNSAPKVMQVTMTGLPTIRVRTTSNREYELDTDSSEFAYLVPFSGYVRSDAGKFCKPDGSEYRPSKTLIKRFIGPAVASTNDACCKDKPILKGRLELKTGEFTDVFFADSCFGYEVDFIGRDHFGGEFVFLKFNDIAEIIFP